MHEGIPYPLTLPPIQSSPVPIDGDGAGGGDGGLLLFFPGVMVGGAAVYCWVSSLLLLLALALVLFSLLPEMQAHLERIKTTHHYTSKAKRSGEAAQYSVDLVTASPRLGSVPHFLWIIHAWC